EDRQFLSRLLPQPPRICRAAPLSVLVLQLPAPRPHPWLNHVRRKTSSRFHLLLLFRFSRNRSISGTSISRIQRAATLPERSRKLRNLQSASPTRPRAGHRNIPPAPHIPPARRPRPALPSRLRRIDRHLPRPRSAP